MWITLLWQNKGLVACAFGALLVLGLGLALKVQSSRLTTAQAKIGEAETQRDAAIEAHDALVKDWERQKAIMSEREAARQQQEADNAKLRQTLREALRNARVWADTPLPDGVLRSLQTLPEAGPPPGTPRKPPSTGIPR